MTLDRPTRAIALTAAAATLAVLVLVNFVGMDPGEQGGTVPFLVTAAVALGAWLVAFAWYAPRAERPAVGGVAAGLFGLVSVLAFWSGLPIVLGAAAVALGARGRDRDPGAGIAAIALGAAALVAAAAMTVYDRMG